MFTVLHLYIFSFCSYITFFSPGCFFVFIYFYIFVPFFILLICNLLLSSTLAFILRPSVFLSFCVSVSFFLNITVTLVRKYYTRIVSCTANDVFKPHSNCCNCLRKTVSWCRGLDTTAQHLPYFVTCESHVTLVHYVVIKYRLQFYWWNGNDLVIKMTSVERNSIN